MVVETGQFPMEILGWAGYESHADLIRSRRLLSVGHQRNDDQRRESQRNRDDSGLAEWDDGGFGIESVDAGVGVGAEQDPRQ